MKDIIATIVLSFGSFAVGVTIAISFYSWAQWRVEQESVLPGDTILIPIVGFHLWLWARVHSAVGSKETAVALDELRTRLVAIDGAQH